MNTTPESPPPQETAPPERASQISAIFRALSQTPGIQAAQAKDEALAAAQNELIAEKDARKAERFYWIFAAILSIDLLVFKDAKTWSGPVIIGLLEFVFLISLGRYLGVSDIWTLTERIIEKWNGQFKGGA